MDSINYDIVRRGKSYIIIASYCGNEYNFKYLVENGANINQVDKDGKTPLIIAIDKRINEIVIYLIDKGANIDQEDNDGNTALFHSVMTGNYDITKHILERGASLNIKNKKGETPIMIAFEKRYNRIAKLLLGYGADVNQKDKNERSILFTYFERGSYEMIKYFIEHGADINKTDSNGDTLLILSSKFEKEELVKSLIDHGADINHENNEGCTALTYSLLNKNETLVKYMVDNGISVNNVKKKNEKSFDDDSNSVLSDETLNYDDIDSVINPLNDIKKNNSIKNGITYNHHHDRIWVKTNYKWNVKDDQKNFRYLGNKKIDRVNYINMDLICNKFYVPYLIDKEKYLYNGVVLYEFNTKKFYIIFIRGQAKSFSQKLYFGTNYQFYKVFEFAESSEKLNDNFLYSKNFAHLDIRITNDDNDVLQTINLNMENITGSNIRYDSNSIFFNTGEGSKDKSNCDAINKYSNYIRYTTVDILDDVIPSFTHYINM